MAKLLLKYNEYAGGDYEMEVTSQIMVEYFQFLGYPRSKANLIVGGIEKLDFLATGDWVPLVDYDHRFYDWALEYCREKAKKEFGFEGYLVAYINKDTYWETLFNSFKKACSFFTKLQEANKPCALFVANANGGWKVNPAKCYEYKKVRRCFERKHINSRRKKGAENED